MIYIILPRDVTTELNKVTEEMNKLQKMVDDIQSGIYIKLPLKVR